MIEITEFTAKVNMAEVFAQQTGYTYVDVHVVFDQQTQSDRQTGRCIITATVNSGGTWDDNKAASDCCFQKCSYLLRFTRMTADTFDMT